MLIWAGLHPFHGWHGIELDILSRLPGPATRGISKSEALAEFLQYLPAGLFMALALQRAVGVLTGGLAAAAAGSGIVLLSGALQLAHATGAPTGQTIAANGAGVLAGIGLAWMVRPGSGLAMRLRMLREAWLMPGAFVGAGFAVLVLATFAGLGAIAPSTTIGALKSSVGPVWLLALDSARPNPAAVAANALQAAGLGLLAALLLKPGAHAFRAYVLFVTGALAAKGIAVVLLLRFSPSGWALSVDVALGLAMGLLALHGLLRLPRNAWPASAAAALLGSFVAGLIAPDRIAWNTQILALAWVPFQAHLPGMVDFLERLAASAPFLALAWLANLVTPYHRRGMVAVAGVPLALAVGYGAGLLAGGGGDGIRALFAVAGWLAPWGWRPGWQEGQSGAAPPRESGPRRWRTTAGMAATLVISTAAAGLLLGHTFERPLDQRWMPRLPQAEALPPPLLPHFRRAHPRLPAPTSAEIARLERDNPGYFDLMRQLAKQRGDLYAATLLAKAYPGSQDLAELHSRLMALEFVDRGNDQGKPLAVAYDWLYDQWTEPQRAALRRKLAEGCNYIIHVIREHRLSPYNVYLYNSPAQALMAMTLALYGDDPRGDDVMRFTHDLWKNRILPVWRQIMGRNGGWHEGGEYVWLGIGQAIYQLPAMWRSVTGEDLFASEPGIRGFLDFLVYRRRPDETPFRWGDVGALEGRGEPDFLALALEYREPAAYTFGRAPKDLRPTSWPWGPLTDPSLYDPGALSSMPLARHFDGIGMIVARNGWGPDATYLSFKAGDNYWSHSHLDQGAFNIYKGGALAIDAGFYGPHYGADHHMNYTYQTIAHNTVTVTDPADTVASVRGIGKFRAIANDGGQRRIGSGWGVEPAPLDIAEWRAKSEIYHTGKIERLLDRDGLIVAAADVTPAYTNRYSGQGTFSHRTRRVERFWRTFGYDRVDDVIVIFDQVRATQPHFRKRWLLHTIERPAVAGAGFTVGVQPADRPAHVGGRLAGTVLLPRKAVIHSIGGKGFEFYVDGRNYDENGMLAERMLNPGAFEPGAWRIEVTPPGDNAEDNFLVVLLPSTLDRNPPHAVRLLESGNRVGCEIVGPRRTTRWWFIPGRSDARVEIVEHGAAPSSRSLDVPALP
ncbi:MAG: DUF4962 domain-containing protein [Pseudomonadota bacterium]